MSGHRRKLKRHFRYDAQCAKPAHMQPCHVVTAHILYNITTTLRDPPVCLCHLHSNDEVACAAVLPL